MIDDIIEFDLPTCKPEPIDIAIIPLFYKYYEDIISFIASQFNIPEKIFNGYRNYSMPSGG
jgi:hypothetical protein